ncbi:MAG: tRNA epoxyqueuosine(34) reductase QueG [Acidobacteriaceae bacterium]|jgi:epoxyqueuosine reductase|nr:tRNA epoxyqueuosine(34) reductase QueG [Acidobacteriaceae bacterium]
MTSADIKAKAQELGFDLCGIAPAVDHPELAFFADWVRRGYAASMRYLTDQVERRSDVRHVLPTARTVIMTATVYNTDRPYSTHCRESGRAHIARYAWGDDYHEVIGERLDRLLTWMREVSGEPFDARAYVDTGPVQERVYAQYAGLGWIGKNSCVINPELGSWLFLGEILCSLPLEIDEPSFDQCGTCTECLKACPTGALVAPGELDSNRCISYLTIEHRGELPAEMTPLLGTFVYGCDICQDVCPWNLTAAVSPDRPWQPRAAWDGRSVADFEAMSDEALQVALRKSPMKRTKLAGLRRNIAVARKNLTAKEQA